MNRSAFLRISGLGTFGLATRGFVTRSFAFPEDYTGIPVGIRPYLQTLRPDSMWVSWWSDSAPDGQIEWGFTADNLLNTVAAATQVLGANFTYHAGQITGLQPSTFYYYRVRNGASASGVFRFRTPPPAGTKTGCLRVLVMGDNQIIAENRYEKLIACAKAKIEATYGKPIEEVIDFILMPGDQVDVGTLEHYRNLHFKQCGLITPNLPVMTTVGNHETYYDTNMGLYNAMFRYTGINYGGIPSPGGNLYYAYQIANVAFIHTSSEHTGDTQKNWVRSIVDALKTDPNVDFAVSVVHRPYQAEQYLGDISGWFRSQIMPILAETEKHVLNIGAHHHLYARGQTREWPVYHIISGGTAWDQYWGQSNEQDFDDVQKTVANWAWQILDFDLANKSMEVTCYAEANVRLPAATRWNYNSRLIDSFHRRLGLAAPLAPALTNVFTQPVTLPFALNSTPYQTSTVEVMNSAWFQVASDAGFSSLKIDRIRDVENLYGDTGAPLYEPVNIHANLNILDFNLNTGALSNGTYHARVRHRDANAMWSPWSAPVTFEITGSTSGPTAITLAKSVYAPNEDITVTYENGPGIGTDWVGIYRKGQTPGPTPSTTWLYVNAGSLGSGTLLFTMNLPAGVEWFAAFFTSDGYAEIAPRIPFYVGTTPALTSSKATYDNGETVQINYSNAPAGATDWIGIYSVGQIPGQIASTQWQYVTGAAGQMNFPGLGSGYYFAAYMVNDGYFEISGRLSFSIGDLISTVTMETASIVAGDSFTVEFINGPGIPKDYIGIFRVGATPGVDLLIAYLYVGGQTGGSVTFELPNMEPGYYFLALYTNDSYTEVSPRLAFTVRPFEVIATQMDGNQMRVRWNSTPGKTYVVQKSTDPYASWQHVRSVVASADTHEEILTVDPAAEPECFFRVITP